MKNILILSAGRRVELVLAFIAELQKVFPGREVMAVDIQPDLSAACQVANRAFAVPSATSEDYPHFLMDLCVKHDVGLVVPTIDTELAPLSENRECFVARNIDIIISDISLIKTCLDKRKTPKLLKKLGIATPEIYPRNAIQFPCFAKPYAGSSGVGAITLWDKSMLSDCVLKNKNMMFMQLISDAYDEFTIDAYYNREGELKCLVPRQRLEVRGGEISKGITRHHVIYDYLLPKLNKLKGARGCVTFQLFANLDKESYYGIEMNPRFGGGYPLSYIAGANYPRWLIQEYLGDRQIAFFDQWEKNLLMLRYDAKVLVENAEI